MHHLLLLLSSILHCHHNFFFQLKYNFLFHHRYSCLFLLSLICLRYHSFYIHLITFCNYYLWLRCWFHCLHYHSSLFRLKYGFLFHHRYSWLFFLSLICLRYHSFYILLIMVCHSYHWFRLRFLCLHHHISLFRLKYGFLFHHRYSCMFLLSLICLRYHSFYIHLITFCNYYLWLRCWFHCLHYHSSLFRLKYGFLFHHRYSCLLFLSLICLHYHSSLFRLKYCFLFHHRYSFVFFLSLICLRYHIFYIHLITFCNYYRWLWCWFHCLHYHSSLFRLKYGFLFHHRYSFLLNLIFHHHHNFLFQLAFLLHYIL